MRREALVYVRVSSQKQVGNYSLDGQEEACRAFCEAEGWAVRKVFREEGESAKTANRTRSTELRDYCRVNQRIIVAVVVHSVSRWSRETHDYFMLKHTLLKWGVQLRSATEQIGDDPAGTLTETLLAGFAKFENQVRSERTRGG